MGHAEFLFAAIEDQWHDEILFIVEMPDQPFEQDRACLGVAFAAATKSIRIASQRLQQRVGGLRRSRHIAMNVVMVAFQNIKTDGQPGVRSAEDREIVKVLDLMVNVQLIQNELQPPCELARELHGWEIASAKLFGDLFDGCRQFAKHGVPRQPETGHLAQIGVGVPLLARIAVEQHAHVLRPTAAAGQGKCFDLGGMSSFDSHEGLHSHCARECEGQSCAA